MSEEYYKNIDDRIFKAVRYIIEHQSYAWINKESIIRKVNYKIINNCDFQDKEILKVILECTVSETNTRNNRDMDFFTWFNDIISRYIKTNKKYKLK